MPSKNQIKQYIRAVRIAHDSRIADSLGGGGGGSSSSEIILPTVASSVDGGFWLDVSGETPVPKFSYGGTVYTLGGSETPSTPDYSEYLVANLPFTTSVTEDTCGNTWTTYGSPTIQDGVLSLNGSSWLSSTDFTLGGQDFTIDFRTAYTAGQFNYFWSFVNEANNFVSANTNIEGVPYIYNSADNAVQYATTSDAFTDERHVAVVYQHTAQTLKLYVAGVNIATLSTTISRATSSRFFVGKGLGGNLGDFPLHGTLSHFRIYDGVALWTEDFTVPTEADYV